MKHLHRLLLLFLLPGLFFSTTQLEAARGRSGDDGLVVRVEGDALIVEWDAPELRINTLEDGSSSLEADGYELTTQPGKPQLPYASLLVAVPPGAQPVLEFLQIRESERSLPSSLALAPYPQGVRRAQNGQVLGGDFIPAPAADMTLSASAPASASEPVILEQIGTLRGVQLARLVFFPGLIEGRRLRTVEQVRLQLRFEHSGEAAGQSRPLQEPFFSILEKMVVNPQHLLSSAPSPVPSFQPSAVTAGETVAIEVEQPGLTAVTYEDLASAGFPLDSANLPNLQLSREGVEIPFEIEGDGDNRLEPGERLLFYAAPRFSRYSTFDVYVLTQGSSPRRSLGSRSASPAGLTSELPRMEKTFEENRYYTPDCYCAPVPAGRDGDRWVWEELSVPARPEASFSFDVPEADVTREASLRAWLIGFTSLSASPDHKVEFILNGQSLGGQTWDGKQAREVSLNVPAGLLKTSANQLILRLPGDLPGVAVDGVWLDAFRVEYWRAGAASGDAFEFSGAAQARAYTLRLNSTSGVRAYDITDSENPLRLTNMAISGNQVSLGDPPSQGGRRYWIGVAAARPRVVRQMVPLSGASGADYLVIAPAAFHAALEPLITLRNSQGLQTALVDIQAIYDSYGGRPEPEAIREFLAQAYATWSPQPSYVLLAGDGASDPKRYIASSALTFIPPLLADVDPWAGETAADNRFAALDGNDRLPDLMIGRLPVNSPEETQAVVNKIVHYENGAGAGRWQGRALFTADDADDSGPFAEQSEKLVRTGAALSMFPSRLYYQSGKPVEGHRQALFNAWEEGVGLLFYTGHSSIHQWGSEAFIHLNDVASLENGFRLPVVLELTCFTGSFQVPGFRTLDEALLTHPGGGAVAVWGPTGLGISTGHGFLAEGFLNQLKPGSRSPLGAAALAGKVRLAESGQHLDLLDTYTILGDPALGLRLEQINTSDLYLPAIMLQK